jgi:hypothetical protein
MRSAYGARAGRAWSARALRSSYGARAERGRSAHGVRSACALRSSLGARTERARGARGVRTACARSARAPRRAYGARAECAGSARGVRSLTSPCAGTECVRSAFGACAGCEENLLLSEGDKQGGGGVLLRGAPSVGVGRPAPSSRGGHSRGSIVPTGGRLRRQSLFPHFPQSLASLSSPGVPHAFPPKASLMSSLMSSLMNFPHGLPS